MTRPEACAPAPRVSIIIPTYNAESTLESCLDSVVAQTARDLEVLVVDGGSSDATVAIARRYASEHPFVRCVSEADRGIYDAMNKGIAMTNGEWLYFLGADDALFDAATLAHLQPHFDAAVDLVYGNILRMTTGRVEGRACTDDDLLDKTICHQAIFYRRELFRRLGHYNLDYKVCGDWDFNIRCFGSRCRTRYVDMTICRYDGAGFSSTTTDKVFLDRKMKVISEAYGVSLLNPLFRSRRHDFYYAAMRARQQRKLLQFAGSYLLYAYHATLAGQAFARLWQRVRGVAR